MTYKAYPIKILDQQDRVTRKKTTQFYRVQWNDHSEDEATWEREEYLRSNYPEFLLQGKVSNFAPAFFLHWNLGARFLFRGGGVVTPRVMETIIQVITN
jgi:hypothetical protein